MSDKNINLGSIRCNNIDNLGRQIDLVEIYNLSKNITIKDCPINISKFKSNLRRLNDESNIIDKNLSNMKNTDIYTIVSLSFINIFLIVILFKL